MIATMLVPLDGSEAAEAALGYAALIPSERVRLVRVEPDITPATTWGVEWQADVEAEALAYLDQRAERLRRQGREVETVLVRGDAAEQILTSAAGVDLIVMTTRGRGSGQRALFGSVADRVARHAAAPTLLVRVDGVPDASPRVARIVVPLDGSAVATEALPAAADMASLLGVPVHLVRVVESDPVRASVQAGSRAAAAHARAMDDHRQQAAGDLATAAQGLISQDLPVTSEVRAGNPAAELLGLIAPTDLVVMTSHGRGGVRRWLLGSVADKLVREAAAPVLLVHVGSGRSA